MKQTLLGCVVAAAIALPVAAIAQTKDWNFGDGVSDERWSALNTQYAMCDMGKMQSPIDLTGADAMGSVQLETNFGRLNGKLAMGEEKVQIDFDQGQNAGMMSGGKAYNLLQVHFHTPAEHAVNGARYPMTAHFVHATADGELGVLGVMFAEGSANPGLATLIEAYGRGNGAVMDIDADSMLPDDLAVFRYMGSLTTPPCSEGVNWHVADRPVTASPEQIQQIASILGPTARSMQPRNKRLLVQPR